MASHGMYHVLIKGLTNSPCETNEISVNGNLCYCSEKEKGSSAREDRPIVSEEIEKSAINTKKVFDVCIQPSSRRLR
jgi:hypothetical protein